MKQTELFPFDNLQAYKSMTIHQRIAHKAWLTWSYGLPGNTYHKGTMFLVFRYNIAVDQREAKRNIRKHLIF